MGKYIGPDGTPEPTDSAINEEVAKKALTPPAAVIQWQILPEVAKTDWLARVAAAVETAGLDGGNGLKPKYRRLPLEAIRQGTIDEYTCERKILVGEEALLLVDALAENVAGGFGMRFMLGDGSDLGGGDTLCLDGMGIDDAGAVRVACALEALPRLQVLRLENNRVGEDGAAAIGKALEAAEGVTRVAFKVLRLYNNSIGDVGAAALATSLKEVKVDTLNLAKNGIGDEGAKAIGALLAATHSLIQLRVDLNKIGDEGAEALAAALDANRSLKVLHANHNEFSEQGKAAIRAATAGKQELFGPDELVLYELGV